MEVGPGSVLTGLVGKILAGKDHVAVNLDRKGRHGLTSLLDGLGRLAVAGVPVDFAALWAEYRERGVRILALCPGATDTPFFARSGEGAAAGTKKARPEDVVRVALSAFIAGRASVIQGVTNNFLAFLGRFLGRELTAKAVARIAKPKELTPQRG